jgi:hypothetical protein
MSIIIQVGHKTSESKQVMEKLYERGLNRPIDSYTHKMNPKRVSETLHKILSCKGISSTDERMADSIMTDFLLANLDTENWGWESDKNLANLSYWKQTIPDVKFILVFDHPNNIMKKSLSLPLTLNIVDQAIIEWVDYHQELLRFLESNSEEAILIEGIGAFNNFNILSEQVKNLDSDLQFKSSWQLLNNRKEIPTRNDWEIKNDTLVDILTVDILRNYPEVIKTFNAMLEKACIKYSNPICKTKEVDFSKVIESINYTHDIKIAENNRVKEESKLLKQKHDIEIRTYKNIIEKYKKEIDSSEEKNIVQKEMQENFLTNQKNISEYKPEADRIDNHNDIDAYSKNLRQENKSLIKQLHYVQEELEQYYLKDQPLNNSNAFERKRKKITTDQVLKSTVHYGAAERIKQDLPYRLGATMIRQGKSAKGIAILPLSLAIEYNKFKKSKINKKALPEIESYYDFDEAERVKAHLSYKLGKTVLDGFANPRTFISLPISISREVLDFKNS